MKDGDKIIQLARQKQRLNRLMPEVKAPIFNVGYGDTTHDYSERFNDCIEAGQAWHDIDAIWYVARTHNN